MLGYTAIDEVGNTYGRLTVVRRAGSSKNGSALWLCYCDCGKEIIRYGSSLRSGDTESCGCIHSERMRKTRKPFSGQLVIDEIGNRYGRLTVIERGKNSKYNRAMWLCRCDCGNETLISGSSLRRASNTKSCGCLRSEASRDRRILPQGVASFNATIGQMKFSAKKRGHAWTLTKEQAHHILKQDCHYCGNPPQQKMERFYNGFYIHGGIDRIDNNKGYTIKNIVPCCKTCNIAKHTMTQDEFLTWILRVYAHSINKG